MVWEEEGVSDTPDLPSGDKEGSVEADTSTHATPEVASYFSRVYLPELKSPVNIHEAARKHGSCQGQTHYRMSGVKPGSKSLFSTLTPLSKPGI